MIPEEGPYGFSMTTLGVYHVDNPFKHAVTLGLGSTRS